MEKIRKLNNREGERSYVLKSTSREYCLLLQILFFFFFFVMLISPVNFVVNIICNVMLLFDFLV